MPVDLNASAGSRHSAAGEESRHLNTGTFSDALRRSMSWFSQRNGDAGVEVEIEAVVQDRDDCRGWDNEGLGIARLTMGSLEHLVGQSLDLLDLGLIESGRRGSPEVEWTSDNIAKIISHCGPGVINAPTPEEKSLFHEAVTSFAFDCADQLLSYASEQKISIALDWGREDILGWALAQQQKSAAEFVLQRILDKCATPMDSSRIIRKHFAALLKKIPSTMQKLIGKDSFCFEYDRFQVPAELLKGRESSPIATNSTDVVSWETSDDNEVRQFWRRSGLEMEEALDLSNGPQVTAVSKFICINCPYHKQPLSALAALLSSKCSVEIFKSTAVKTLVQWQWHLSSRYKQSTLLLLNVVSAVLFFEFATEFGTDDENTDELLSTDTVYALIWSITLALWALLFSSQPLSILYVGGTAYHYYLCRSLASNADDTAFLTSTHNLLILVLVLQNLRRFKRTLDRSSRWCTTCFETTLLFYSQAQWRS